MTSSHSSTASKKRLAGKKSSATRSTRYVNLPLLIGSIVGASAVLLVGYFFRAQRQEQVVDYYAERSRTLAEQGDSREALAYQQLYVQARPEDLDARQTLVELAGELLDSVSARQYYVRVLYETMGLLDQADEEQSRTAVNYQLLAAEQQRLLGDWREAEILADAVAQSQFAEFHAAALRIRALARAAQFPAQGAISEAARQTRLTSELLPELIAAFAQNQTDVALASTAAAYLRELPPGSSFAGKSGSEGAETVLETLVASAPEDPDARLARYRYRTQYGLPGAMEDLEAASEADPSHFETNLALGYELGRSRDADLRATARKYFEAARQSRPADERGHLGLATHLWSVGAPEEAIDVLVAADDALGDTAFAAQFLLSDFLLARGELEDCRGVYEKLQRRIQTLQGRLSAAAREQLTYEERLLGARLAAAEGDASAVLRVFESISVAREHDSLNVVEDRLWRESQRGAGRALVSLGRADQAALLLSDVANRMERELSQDDNLPPSLRSGGAQDSPIAGSFLREYALVRTEAADAFRAAGLSTRAKAEIEKVGRAASLPSETRLAQLFVELSLQLQRPREARQWQEFELLLKEAKESSAQDVRVFLAELFYMRATSEEGPAQNASVERLLDEGAERFAGEPEFWFAAASWELESGDATEADSKLQRFLELEQDTERRARSYIALLVAANRSEEASTWLDRQITQAAESRDRIALQRLRVELLRRLGKSAEALQLAEEQARKAPDNELVCMTALELAAANNNWELAAELEQQLTQIIGYEDWNVRYFQALRQMENFASLDAKARSALISLIRRLDSERPDLRAVAMLSARLAEVQGDAVTAIEAYDRAVNLGDRRSETVLRLARLLIENGEYARAQELLDRNAFAGDSNPLEVEALALDSLTRQRRIDEAVARARTAAADNPTEPIRRLWLYQLLRSSGEGTEAKDVLARGRHDFPDDLLLWNAELLQLVSQGALDEARKLLDALPDAEGITPATRQALLARGRRLVGDYFEAERAFADALEDSPNNVELRLAYAETLLHLDLSRAQQQLELVLSLDPGNAQARGRLAALLAVGSQSPDWNRIEQLIGKGDSAAQGYDARVRAMLLLRRGRNTAERRTYCLAAVDLLTEEIGRSASKVVAADRLLLATAYGQLAQLTQEATYLEKAANELRTATDSVETSAQLLQYYLAFLQRSIEMLQTAPDEHGLRSEFYEIARETLPRFEQRLAAEATVPPAIQSLAVLEFDVKFRTSAGDVEGALERVNEFIEETIPKILEPTEKEPVQRGVAQLCTLLGAHDLAAAQLRKVVGDAPVDRLRLATALVQAGEMEEALRLFQRGESLSASDAAMLAFVVASAGPDPALYQDVLPMLEQALAEVGEDSTLLRSIALLHIVHGNNDEAVALLRRALKTSPRGTLILNDLATLLGEEDESRSEALRLIETAISIGGAQPSFLDTLGTIQLHLDNLQEAIDALEHAVAFVEADPRYYFHLAVAYARNGERDKARGALDEARSRELADSLLTESDRDLLNWLEAELELSLVDD